MRRTVTVEERLFVKKNAKLLSDSKLAEATGLSKSTIQKVRLLDGVLRAKSSEERVPHNQIKEFIEENKDSMSDAEMANELGYSFLGFQKLRVKLGFSKHCHTRSQPNHELERLIKDNWRTKTDKEIALLVSPSFPAYNVRHRRKRLGFKK